MTKVRRRLMVRERLLLHKTGLSPDAISLYDFLLSRRNASAAEAGTELGTFATATYRLFYELEGRGMVERLAGRPRRFAAVPKARALPGVVGLYRTELMQLLYGKRSPEHVAAEGYMGQELVHDACISAVVSARVEVSIASTAVLYSDELYRALEAAIARGVVIRHSVGHVRPKDKLPLRKLLRLGVQMRLRESAAEDRFLIVDRCQVLHIVRDPYEASGVVTTCLDHEKAAHIYASCFMSIWQAGRQLPKI